MKRNLLSVLWVVIIAFATFDSTGALAIPGPGYEVTPLLVTGYDRSTVYPWAINDSGQVVGDAGMGWNNNVLVWENGMTKEIAAPLGGNGISAINNTGQVAFSGANPYNGVKIWENGTITNLGTLQGYNNYGAYTWGINNVGQVVGEAYVTSGNMSYYQAFVSQNGSLNNLGTLNPNNPIGISSSAHAINDLGQIAGMSWNNLNGGLQYRAVTWESGTIRDLGTSGNSVANDINNIGQVVGQSSTGAFLWQDDTIQSLGTLQGDTRSIANAINDSGLIVGQSSNIWLQEHSAVLWQNGQIADLNSLINPNLGLRLEEAVDINESGQIIARGLIPGIGYAEGVLLDPDWDSFAAPGSPFYMDIILGRKVSFDYWWDMGTEPPPYEQGYMFDVLALQVTGGWQFIGQTAAYNSSTGWNTAEFGIPDELQGLQTQIRFVLSDFYPESDPTVFLSNIRVQTAPVPEPATMLLFASGLVGLAGLRRRMRKS